MYILQYPVNGYFDAIQDFSNETYKYFTDLMKKKKNLEAIFPHNLFIYYLHITTILHTLNFKIDRNT